MSRDVAASASPGRDARDDSPTSRTEYPQHRSNLPAGGCAVLLVRHGESQPYILGEEFAFIDGHSDPPLAPDGHVQAQRVADRLAGHDLAAIYATTLTRTQQTAAPLAAATGLTPRVEPDLREVHLGEWEGALFRQRVVERHPLARQMWREQRWDVIPGAEPVEALQARVRASLERIAAAHADQMVAAFTHGGVIGTIASLATGATPFAFIGADNGSITHLVVSPGGWSEADPAWGTAPDGHRLALRRFNDTGHLPTDFDVASEPLI